MAGIKIDCEIGVGVGPGVGFGVGVGINDGVGVGVCVGPMTVRFDPTAVMGMLAPDAVDAAGLFTTIAKTPD